MFMHPNLGIKTATLVSDAPLCVLDFRFRIVLRLFVFCLVSCQLEQKRETKRRRFVLPTLCPKTQIPARIGAQRDSPYQGPHVDNNAFTAKDPCGTGVKRSACGCSRSNNCPRINFKYYFGRSVAYK